MLKKMAKLGFAVLLGYVVMMILKGNPSRLSLERTLEIVQIVGNLTSLS